MSVGRDRSLELLRQYLGLTELGRAYRLDRLATLDDLRASVPLMDRGEHETLVEPRLGFGVLDVDDERATELGARERENVVGVWRAWLRTAGPHRVAVLRGHHADPLVDRVLVDDVKDFGGSMLRVDDGSDVEAALRRLETHDPHVLVVPSASTVAWLEQVHRTPIERRLPHLSIVLAEHELNARTRSRARIESAGWTHVSGRMGLPSLRSPRNGLVLAVGTQILELLPDKDAEEHHPGRGPVRDTILPEQAVLGQRYELVITSPLGYLRYRTGEHVRVVGFDMPSAMATFPRPRIVRLPPAPPDVPLEGCTLAGPWLTASLRQAFRREDPALVAAEIGPDPDGMPLDSLSSTASMRLPGAFADTELGWLARTGHHRRDRNPRNLLVRVEVQGHASRWFTQALALRMDRDLSRRSPAYAHLRGRGDLDPPRLLVVPAGTYRAEQERRLRSLLGPMNQPEVRVVA